MGSPPPKLAVLIDADNACAAKLEQLMAEIAIRGTPVIRRAFGDWTDNQLRPWKEKLLPLSIQPVQQFAYTRGKNATDSALIIDAMDLLHSKQVDGFCLVSSDSDFTRLAARLREDSMLVFGLGSRKTPLPFAAACNEFIYVDDICVAEASSATDTDIHQPRRVDDTGVSEGPSVSQTENPQPHRVDSGIGSSSSRVSDEDWLREALHQTLMETTDPVSWISLCTLGPILAHRHPDFHKRMSGNFKNLRKLTESDPTIESQVDDTGKHLVRLRNRPT